MFEVPVGNYYGSLCFVMTTDGPKWSVENWDGYHWVDCPQGIWDAVVAEYGPDTGPVVEWATIKDDDND